MNALDALVAAGLVKLDHSFGNGRADSPFSRALAALSNGSSVAVLLQQNAPDDARKAFEGIEGVTCIIVDAIARGKNKGKARDAQNIVAAIRSKASQDEVAVNVAAAEYDGDVYGVAVTLNK